MRELSRQVARNALFGGIARLLTLLVGLFLTPYLLARLGPEQFAIWALVGVVIGGFGLLDLSLRAGFVKHLAEALAQGDRQAVSAVMATGVAAYLVFSLVVTGGYLVLRTWILGVLNIPVSLQTVASQVFAIGLASFLVGAVLSVFASVCDAKQRMDLTHGLGLVSLAISTIATVASVEKGFGLRGVALAQLLGVVLFYAATAMVSWRLVGEIGVDLGSMRWSWFTRLLRFGSILHLSTACGIVNRQFDKLLLSSWSGLATVTSYEVAARLVTNVSSFQPFLAASLLPAASHLDSLGQRRQLTGLYLRASRYLFLLGIPPFVFLAANSESIMIAWLGHPEPLAAAVLLVLAGGFLVNSLSNAMAFVCQGIGRPDLQARQSALQLAVNVGASLILFAVIGPLGAPLGTSLALVLGAVVFARQFHKLLDLSTLALLREAAWIPLLASLAGALVGTLTGSWIPPDDRVGALSSLALNGAVFTLTYFAVCFRTSFLGRADLAWLRTALEVRSEGRP